MDCVSDNTWTVAVAPRNKTRVSLQNILNLIEKENEATSLELATTVHSLLSTTVRPTTVRGKKQLTIDPIVTNYTRYHKLAKKPSIILFQAPSVVPSLVPSNALDTSGVTVKHAGQPSRVGVPSGSSSPGVSRGPPLSPSSRKTPRPTQPTPVRTSTYQPYSQTNFVDNQRSTVAVDLSQVAISLPSNT